MTFGGHTPFHLTHGRADDEIKKELFALTHPDLRELPDSETDDSEDEEDGQSDEEVGARWLKTPTAHYSKKKQKKPLGSQSPCFNAVVFFRWVMMTSSGTATSRRRRNVTPRMKLREKDLPRLSPGSWCGCSHTDVKGGLVTQTGGQRREREKLTGSCRSLSNRLAGESTCSTAGTYHVSMRLAFSWLANHSQNASIHISSSLV